VCQSRSGRGGEEKNSQLLIIQPVVQRYTAELAGSYRNALHANSFGSYVLNYLFTEKDAEGKTRGGMQREP
jgi:hypothetical protein